MVDIHPYLIDDDNAIGKALVPIPVRERAFQEEWLQELLFKHPSILPIDYIDDAFIPLVSIGREIGNIDNLFISPSGLLTVVETKLWRNPEAHRTVVAQILDYAKTLTSWTYDTLNQAVISYMAKRNGSPLSIYEAVKARANNFNLSEVEFHSKVEECLSNGKFALVIVGDRIFPGATQLAEIIQSAPHLQFALGFIELRCYRLEKGTNWPLIVIPNFLTKTKEITRAVVKVVYEEKKPEVQIDTLDEDKTTSKTSFPVFIASLPSDLQDTIKGYLEHWMKAGYTVYWGSVGFSLRLPINGKLVTIMDAYPTFIGILTEKWMKRNALPRPLFEKYKAALMSSPFFSSAIASGRTYLNYENMSADNVALILNTVDELAKEIYKLGNQ